MEPHLGFLREISSVTFRLAEAARLIGNQETSSHVFESALPLSPFRSRITVRKKDRQTDRQTDKQTDSSVG